MKSLKWSVMFLGLILCAGVEAAPRVATSIECAGRGSTNTNRIILHWDDGIEGSMTVEERRADGTLVGYYRQAAINLDATCWRILLPADVRLAEKDSGRYLEQLGDHPIEIHDRNRRLMGFCKITQ